MITSSLTLSSAVKRTNEKIMEMFTKVDVADPDPILRKISLNFLDDDVPDCCFVINFLSWFTFITSNST